MQWIAPSEKDTAADTLGKRLWDAADQFRANSGPILSLSCYDDPHDATGRFDFVLANPPLKANAVDKGWLAQNETETGHKPEAANAHECGAGGTTAFIYALVGSGTCAR